MREEGFKKVALADAPRDNRHGAALHALLTPKAVGATSGFMGAATLQPGEHIREHYHPYSEEFVFLVRGALVAQVDGQRHDVRAGEAFLTPINIPHKLINEGDDEAFIVFSMSPLAPRPELGHVSTEEEQ